MSNKITNKDKIKFFENIEKIKRMSAGNIKLDKLDSKFFSTNSLELGYIDVNGIYNTVKLSKNSLESYIDHMIEVLQYLNSYTTPVQSPKMYTSINIVLLMILKCSNFGGTKGKYVKALIDNCTKNDSEMIDVVYTILIPGTKVKNGVLHNGNTMYDTKELKETIKYKTSLKTQEDIESLILKFFDLGIVSYQDKKLGYEEYFEIENYLAYLVNQKSEFKLPKVKNIKFSKSQSLACEILCESNDRVKLLLGLAGTGKSYVISNIIAECLKQDINVAVACPTNAAVAVISQALEKNGIDTNNLVFNRILTVDAALYDRKNEKKIQLLIVDESSLCSTKHFEIVKKLNPETVIFVGDPEQLPPIEAGCPFVDLAASDKVKTKAYLLEQHRNKSEEVKNVIDEINNDKLNYTKIFPISNNKKLPQEIDDKVFYNFKNYLIKHKDDVFLAEQNNLVDALNVVLLDIKYENETLDDNILKLIYTYFTKSEVNNIDFKKYVGESVIWDGVKFECKIDSNYSIIRGSIGKILPNNMIEMNCIKTKNVNDRPFKSFVFPYEHVENHTTKSDRLRLTFARTIHKSQGSSFPKVTYMVKDSGYTLYNNNLNINIKKDMAYVACSRASESINVICLIHDVGTIITPKTGRDTLLSKLI